MFGRTAQPFRSRDPGPLERKLTAEVERAEVNRRRALHEERVAMETELAEKRPGLVQKIAAKQARVIVAEAALNAARTLDADVSAARAALEAARREQWTAQGELDVLTSRCDSPRRMEIIHELERTADPAIRAARDECAAEIGTLARLARYETVPPRDDDISSRAVTRLLNGPALEARKRALVWADQEFEQLARRYDADVPGVIAAIWARVPSA